ncbi:MAG: DUF4238 domain-containing protein [Roseomonas sp.]
MPNNQPERHHFLPAFHQQPWTMGTDSTICEMKLVNRQVKPKRVHPNASGYRRRLYTTEGIPDDKAQYLETEFFKPIDMKASEALNCLLDLNKQQWPVELRQNWTHYLMSLMYRHPETVSIVKDQSKAIWREGIASLEPDYANHRRPNDPDALADFFAHNRPAAAQVGATELMTKIVSNPRAMTDIAKMNWSVIRPTRSRFTLLLSDRPLIRPLGLNEPDAYIILPISPDALFLASNTHKASNIIASWSHNRIVREINLAVVGQAVEFVWGVDDSQLSFVQNHFGKSPLPPPITAAQRERAVAAARGSIIR